MIKIKLTKRESILRGIMVVLFAVFVIRLFALNMLITILFEGMDIISLIGSLVAVIGFVLGCFHLFPDDFLLYKYENKKRRGK